MRAGETIFPHVIVLLHTARDSLIDASYGVTNGASKQGVVINAVNTTGQLSFAKVFASGARGLPHLMGDPLAWRMAWSGPANG